MIHFARCMCIYRDVTFVENRPFFLSSCSVVSFFFLSYPYSFIKLFPYRRPSVPPSSPRSPPTIIPSNTSLPAPSFVLPSASSTSPFPLHYSRQSRIPQSCTPASDVPVELLMLASTIHYLHRHLSMIFVIVLLFLPLIDMVSPLLMLYMSLVLVKRQLVFFSGTLIVMYHIPHFCSVGISNR